MRLGHIHLCADDVADEIWAAAQLVVQVETYFSILVITDEDLVPLWHFALRGVQHSCLVATTYTEGWDVVVSNAPVERVCNLPMVVFLGKHIHTPLTAQHFQATPSPHSVLQTTFKWPPWALEMEEYIVETVKPIVPKHDVDLFIRRMQEGREMSGAWIVKYRSRTDGAAKEILRAVKDKDTCPICLSPLEDTSQLSMLKACAHVACTSCLSRWLAIGGVCPMCRGKSEVLHTRSTTALFSIDLNPFFPEVESHINGLVLHTNNPVVVASRFKDHPSRVCDAHADEFVLYPPGTLVEGVWVAVAARRAAKSILMHCFYTESITRFQQQVIRDACAHTLGTTRCLTHVVNNPVDVRRVKNAFNE